MRASQRHRSVRRPWVIGGAVVLGALAVVGVAAGLRLAAIAGDLSDAEDLVDSAAVAMEEGRLAEAATNLRQAQTLLTAANRDLYTSVELELGGGLPVLSQNLDAVKDGVSVASTLVNGGLLVLRDAAPLESPDGTLEVPMADGAVPLDAVEATRQQLAVLASSLPDTSEQPNDRLIVGPVRRAQEHMYEEANRRRAQIVVLSRGLQIVGDMAGGNGPRTYLIAVANSAEMRGTGGMILNYGVLEGRDGDFELGEFGRIDELELAKPATLPDDLLPADVLERWDGFSMTELWRNANVAADFEVTAPLLERMYEERTGVAPDGVIQIDPHGLAAVLEGIGPVEVEGVGAIDADNVVPFTLNEAYSRFPGIEERSDVLGDIAEAVFRRLVEGEYDSLRPLAASLVKTVDGRHVLMHSTSQEVENQLRFFQANGSLPAPDQLDYAHLTVQNVAGNKLDYYLDTELRLTGERPVGEPGTVQAEITLTNTAPPGQTQPSYVFGPFNEDQVAGLYRGIVTLYLPSGATLVGTDGDPVRNEPVAQTEGGRPLVSYTVDVPAGASSHVVLDLRLPPRSSRSPYRLLLVPSPRVRPTKVVVDVDTGPSSAVADVTLRRSLWIVPGEEPVPTHDRNGATAVPPG